MTPGVAKKSMASSTAVWGPTFWRVMHTASHVGPPAQFVRLAELMKELIPCRHCRSSYVDYCRRLLPSCCTTGEKAFEWMWAIHDKVDTKLSKEHLPLSKLRQRYEIVGCPVTDDELFAFIFMSTLAAECAASRSASAELGCVLRALFSKCAGLRAPAHLPSLRIASSSALEEYIASCNRMRAERGTEMLDRAHVLRVFGTSRGGP